jgi:hypothetical protein
VEPRGRAHELPPLARTGKRASSGHTGEMPPLTRILSRAATFQKRRFYNHKRGGVGCDSLMITVTAVVLIL